MPLRDTLNDIVQSVDGALASIIMGYDGIPIEEVALKQSDFDIQLMSVEYSSVLKEIKRTIEIIRAGDMEEVSITTGQTFVVMRVLGNELFIALIIRRTGNFGKGRYMLKCKSKELMRELE